MTFTSTGVDRGDSSGRCVLCLVVAFLTTIMPALVFAQVPAPSRTFLFQQDASHPRYKARPPRGLTDAEIDTRSFSGGDDELPFDIDAPTLQYDSSINSVFAEGGMRITHDGAVFEADSGTVALDTGRALLDGNVYFSDQISAINAQEAELDVQTGLGTLRQCQIEYAGGLYLFDAAAAEKFSENQYSLTEATATTCDCPSKDDCSPWRLKSSRVEVTEEGYGKAWNSTLQFYDVPVFYVPYVIFPAKTKRQTGFLPMTFGSGTESGVRFELPFFWALDDSTDALITPLVDTGTRVGTRLNFRKIFSRESALEFGGVYLNESQRDGDLQGTIVDGLFDPTIDENRFAGYLDQRYRTEILGTPLQFILDGNYVSDDLFLREFDTPRIAPNTTRYVTSRALLRTSFLESYSADLRFEYSQALVTDDDVVFQRLPELTVGGIHRWEPFGVNQYGLKVIFANELQAVNFSRSEGFDGLRAELLETVRIPFRYRNIFTSEFSTLVRATQYSLDDQTIPSLTVGPISDEEDEEDEEEMVEAAPLLKRSSNRIIPELNYRVGTVVEKVFPVASDGMLASIAELGELGRAKKLVRMKHTVQPRFKYKYVPFVDQSENPQFDSTDQLAERNVVTFELNQSLFARFDDRNPRVLGLEEATPEISDLNVLQDSAPIEPTLAYDALSVGDGAAGRLQRPTITELVRFKLAQSFDVLEQRKDEDPTRTPWSDLAAEMLILPNEYVGMRLRTDFNVEEQEFSAYTLEGRFRDKRGDELRSRLSFVDSSVRQLESSAEVRVTDRVKLGYYTRYDDLNSEFIENRVGVRLLSDCRCWIFDLEFSDRSNPDEARVEFVLTLMGLGELGNSLYRANSEG